MASRSPCLNSLMTLCLEWEIDLLWVRLRVRKAERPFQCKRQSALSTQHTALEGLSLVSQIAERLTCNSESLAVYKGLSFELKPGQRRILMFLMTAHPGLVKYLKLYSKLSIYTMLTTATMPASSYSKAASGPV